MYCFQAIVLSNIHLVYKNWRWGHMTTIKTFWIITLGDIFVQWWQKHVNVLSLICLCLTMPYYDYQISESSWLLWSAWRDSKFESIFQIRSNDLIWIYFSFIKANQPHDRVQSYRSSESLQLTFTCNTLLKSSSMLLWCLKNI